jgi:beta-galactosidase beta subunit
MNIRTDIRNSLHYEVRDASPEEIQQLIDAAAKLGLAALPAGEFDDDAPQMTVVADTEEMAQSFRNRFRDAFLG